MFKMFTVMALTTMLACSDTSLAPDDLGSESSALTTDPPACDAAHDGTTVYNHTTLAVSKCAFQVFGTPVEPPWTPPPPPPGAPPAQASYAYLPVNCDGNNFGAVVFVTNDSRLVVCTRTAGVNGWVPKNNL